MKFFINIKVAVFVLFITFAVSCITQKSDDTLVTSTYYLIRHAEKDRSDGANKDPDLTHEGLIRADHWSKFFERYKIDAIYSTNYKRTLNTAKPTALANNLEIITYRPSQIDYAQFIKDTKGRNVLIVGHSNTTPGFVNQLIGKEVYHDIDDNNNANLYIVTITGNQRSHVLVKIK